MLSPACAEEMSSCPPSCQLPSSFQGTEVRRHFAGVTQTLLKVTVLLASPLPILEGELNETKPLLGSGAANLSLDKVPHPQLQQWTGLSFRSQWRQWQSHGHLPALVEPRPTGIGRSLMALQGSRQIAPSAHLP